jgi:hypothetical protein
MRLDHCNRARKTEKIVMAGYAINQGETMPRQRRD